MEQSNVSLSGILMPIKKHYSMILNIMLGSAILILVISFLIPTKYEAETSLMVKQSKGLANSLLSEEANNRSPDVKQLMLTYAELLKSRTVVQSVINQTQAGKAEIPKYEDMVKRITTQPVKDTELLKIKVQAESPQEAALLANTLIATFYDRLIALVRAEQSAVRQFIGERVQESRTELEKAEAALEKYKREHKITAPSEDAKAVIDRLTYVKKLAAENAVSEATARARLNTAQQQIAEESPGFMADSPLIQQYKSLLARLEVELVGLIQNYGDRHPKVLAARASIAEAREKLNAEASQIIHNQAPSMNPVHQGLLQTIIHSEAEIAAAAAQREAIERVMSQGDVELTSLPAKEQGITRLTRDVMVAQEIYITLAKRYEEARITEVMQPTDVQIIDTAVVPEKPVFPNKALNTVLAMLFSGFIGAGVAIYQEHANRIINNVNDVKQYLGVPVLGTIPDFDSARHLSCNWLKVTHKFWQSKEEKL